MGKMKLTSLIGSLDGNSKVSFRVSRYRSSKSKLNMNDSDGVVLFRCLSDYSAYRTGNAKTRSNRSQQLKNFLAEFESEHAPSLCESHLKMLMRRKCGQFVGTKSLNCALRFVDSAVKQKITRGLCIPHVPDILFNLSLQLMLVTQHEFTVFTENPIEFVRLQVDKSNSFNVKRANQDLIKNLTNIKQTRKQKLSEYLNQYVQIIVT